MVYVKLHINGDSPWKDILEAYFENFMIFFFPEVAEGVDWERGYTFLDKELRQVMKSFSFYRLDHGIA